MTARLSAAVTALWFASFLLTYTFPLLNAAMSTAGVFLLYAAICLAGRVFLSPVCLRHATEPSKRLKPVFVMPSNTR